VVFAPWLPRVGVTYTRLPGRQRPHPPSSSVARRLEHLAQDDGIATQKT